MKRRGLGVLPVCVPVLLGLLVSGCGGFEDVPFIVTVRNNTPHTIVDYSFFGADYGTKHESSSGMVVTLAPGHSFGDLEYSNEGTDPDRITTPGGKVLGCLPFQFSASPPRSFVVKVTQMVPCRHWAFETNNPKDWPDPNY